MCQIARDYFGRMFGTGERNEEVTFQGGNSVISEVQNRDLVAEFTFDEFTILRLNRCIRTRP